MICNKNLAEGKKAFFFFRDLAKYQISKEVPERLGKKPKWDLQERKNEISSKIDELDKKLKIQCYCHMKWTYDIV
jgi:hypothetical protein